MKIPVSIKIIEKTKSDYDFNGNKGTSRKVRFLEDVDIYELKFRETESEIFDRLPERGDINVVLEVSSPKEVLQMKLIEVVSKKP